MSRALQKFFLFFLQERSYFALRKKSPPGERALRSYAFAKMRCLNSRHQRRSIQPNTRPRKVTRNATIKVTRLFVLKNADHLTKISTTQLTTGIRSKRI